MKGGIIACVRFIYEALFFDPVFYLLQNQDVHMAPYIRFPFGGFVHFFRFGRNEGRSHRLKMFGFRRLSLLLKMFQGEDHSISGIKIHVGKPKGDVPILLFLISYKNFTFRLVAKEFIEQNTFYLNEPNQVNWLPIFGSNDLFFIAFILSGCKMVPFFFDRKTGVIASSPVSKMRVPAGLVISPVTQCNLNCIHCISRSTRSEPSELSEKNWKEIQRYVESGEVRHIASDYSGDLLYLHSRGKPWLQRFAESNVELRIDTHANNLDSKTIDLLLNSNLISINFSMDALTKDDYRRIRKGSAPLEIVKENIVKFMDRKKASSRVFTTVISFTLMKSNIDSLFLAIDFAKETGIEIIQGNHLIVMTEDMQKESLLPCQSYYEEFYRKITAYALERQVHVLLPKPLENYRPRNGHQVCLVFWSSALVLGNGDVMACCMPGTKIGNLNTESLSQIWNGEKMQDFRGRVNSSRSPTPCMKCSFARHQNNFRSYVPGLSEELQQKFETKCVSQKRASTNS